MMSNENMGPVYLKNRNFNELEHKQQLRRSASTNSWDHLSNGVFDYEEKIKENNKFEIQDDIGMPVNYARIKALEDSIRKDIVSDEKSLHRAITPVLMLARCLALLPVQGIHGQNTSYLVFNWCSWPLLYTLVILSSCLLIILFSIIKIYQNGLTYSHTGEIVFFGSSVLVYVVFIYLARKWPKIMANWELMERQMKQLKHTSNTASNFKALTIIFMSLSIIEYAASVLTGIVKAIPCSTGGIDIVRVYFSMYFHQVFTIIHYSFIIALPLAILNLVLICAWNFMDLFIIILAYTLSNKFQKLNEKLDSVKGKVLPSIYWRKSRENYNLLASLTQDFDEFLSPIILLSFAHNLYFICVQLLNSLKPMKNIWEALCFVFLFTYLIGRTCAVMLYAAFINDESKKPKFVLFSVPTESYGVEVARFITQVTADELALTGYNFFSVTRTFMLTVAGTIATYEIVLIQFNNLDSEMIHNNNRTKNYCQDFFETLG